MPGKAKAGKPKPPPKLNLALLNDGKVNEDKKWKMMLDHFKNNPDDLMNAFPTPEGSDDEG